MYMHTTPMVNMNLNFRNTKCKNIAGYGVKKR